MKVIDLLNKIANGEEDRLNKYQFSQNDYCTIDEFFNRYILDEENLNLEIIEDTPKEDKKIEKLDYCEENTFMEQKETTYLSQKERILLDSNFKELGRKINEIIDKINKGEENERDK